MFSSASCPDTVTSNIRSSAIKFCWEIQELSLKKLCPNWTRKQYRNPNLLRLILVSLCSSVLCWNINNLLITGKKSGRNSREWETEGLRPRRSERIQREVKNKAGIGFVLSSPADSPQRPVIVLPLSKHPPVVSFQSFFHTLVKSRNKPSHITAPVIWPTAWPSRLFIGDSSHFWTFFFLLCFEMEKFL